MRRWLMLLIASGWLAAAVLVSPAPVLAQEEPRTVSQPVGFSLVDPSSSLGVPLLSWPNGTLIRTWPGGTLVAWLEGLQTAEGRMWQRVRDPDSNEGWIAQEFLIPLAG